VYGEVTTTPFILSLPFRLDRAVVVEAPTENVDLWPTLLDLLGLPGLDGADGRSRMPELMAAARGEAPPARDGDGLRFAHIDQAWGRNRQEPRPMVAVSDGRYRLIRRAGGDPPELYDREQDPREAVDVAQAQPERAAELAAAAEAYLARPQAPWAPSAPQVELDEEELEQLRALGYAPE
jgi:arylsulfatase A-like enzyme